MQLRVDCMAGSVNSHLDDQQIPAPTEPALVGHMSSLLCDSRHYYKTEPRVTMAVAATWGSCEGQYGG